MKKTALLIACAGLLVGGLTLANPAPAKAGIRVSFGTGGFGYGNRGYTNSYNRGFYNFSSFNRGGLYNNGFNRGFNPGIGRGSYGRGGCDYRPIVVPHRNHLHVVPSRGRGFGGGGFGGHIGH